MARSAEAKGDLVVDALKDLMIIQLALAGVSGHAIRQTVGVSMGRVTRIMKVIKKRDGQATK